MHPNIDPAIAEAISQRISQQVDRLDTTAKMNLAVITAMRIAIMPAPGEDRSLQTDITKVALKLQKAATMMKMVDMIKDAFENGGADKDEPDFDPREVVSEIANAMLATLEVCDEETKKALEQLQNLVDEYKRRYPDMVAEMEKKAAEAWEAKHSN